MKISALDHPRPRDQPSSQVTTQLADRGASGCVCSATEGMAAGGRYSRIRVPSGSRPLYLYVRRGPLDALPVRSLARFTVENYKQFVATVPTIVPAKQSARRALR
jgi:hypothetical protein